jgi:hypothetical protein
MNRALWRVYVCNHIKAGAAPLTVHVDEDGDLSAACGASQEQHPPGSWSVMAWGCLLEQDPTLAPVDEDCAHGVAPNTWYTRATVGAPWVIEPDEPAPGDAAAAVAP